MPSTGVRVLEELAAPVIEPHLIISTWSRRTIEHETGATAAIVERLASPGHRPATKRPSYRAARSGPTACAWHLAASNRGLDPHGVADNLLLRVADGDHQERRPLVLMVRETPLSVTSRTWRPRACWCQHFAPVPAF